MYRISFRTRKLTITNSPIYPKLLICVSFRDQKTSRALVKVEQIHKRNETYYLVIAALHFALTEQFTILF